MTDITDEQLTEWWERASRLAAKDGGGVVLHTNRIRRFAELTREDERERVIEFLMELHERDKGAHNHFKWAANQLRDAK